MERLLERSQTTRTTYKTLIAWIELTSRDDRVHIEAIIWKRPQAIERIRTIEGYLRNHYYSSNQE